MTPLMPPALAEGGSVVQGVSFSAGGRRFAASLPSVQSAVGYGQNQNGPTITQPRVRQLPGRAL